MVPCCTENYLFTTEYPGVIECRVMRAQDVLIIPFRLSWQELGSKLQQSRHWYQSFYYHCLCFWQILLLYSSSSSSKWRSMLCCRFYRLCWGQLLQNIFCKVLLSHVSGFFTIISVFFCYFFKPLFSLFRQLKTLGSSVFWRRLT